MFFGRCPEALLGEIFWWVTVIFYRVIIQGECLEGVVWGVCAGLHVAVMIWSTLVNTHAHTHSERRWQKLQWILQDRTLMDQIMGGLEIVGLDIG